MLLSLAAAAPGLFTCIAHGLATHGLALHGSMAHIGQQLVPCSLLSFISRFIFICPTLRPLLACGFWSLSSPPALLAYNLLGQEGLVMSRQEGLRFFVMWPASLSSASNFHSPRWLYCGYRLRHWSPIAYVASWSLGMVSCPQLHW